MLLICFPDHGLTNTGGIHKGWDSSNLSLKQQNIQSILILMINSVLSLHRLGVHFELKQTRFPEPYLDKVECSVLSFDPCLKVGPNSCPDFCNFAHRLNSLNASHFLCRDLAFEHGSNLNLLLIDNTHFQACFCVIYNTVSLIGTNYYGKVIGQQHITFQLITFGGDQRNNMQLEFISIAFYFVPHSCPSLGRPRKSRLQSV